MVSGESEKPTDAVAFEFKPYPFGDKMFRRNYVYGPNRPRCSPETLDKYRGVKRAMMPQIHQGLRTIRSWTVKGLSGGVLASLTLTGSQIFSGELASHVVTLFYIFLSGLFWCLVSQFLRLAYDYDAQLGQIQRIIDESQGYNPARGWLFCALALDLIAVGILVLNCFWGFAILNQIASGKSL